MTTDYTLSEKQVVIDLIRRDNYNRTLTQGMVNFGLPQAFAPTLEIPRNTVVIGTAVAGSGYSGSQTFYYDRVNLFDFVLPFTPPLEFVIDEEVTIGDLLPRVNAHLGINLTPSVIFDAALPDFGLSASKQVNITMRSTSLVYIGTLAITIIPGTISLEVAMANNSFDDLIYTKPITYLTNQGGDDLTDGDDNPLITS